LRVFLEESRRAYARRRHTFIRGAANSDIVAGVRKDLASGLRRRVCVNEDATVTWDSLDYPDGSWIHQIFFALDRLSFVSDITSIDIREIVAVKAWAHAYREGEFIGPHRDADGACQLVIGVDADCDPSSGLLHVGADGEFVYRLEPGDMLLFEARKLLHWTNPLRPRIPGVAASRSVLVVRYYCGDAA
jgi:hypothetical protein